MIPRTRQEGTPATRGGILGLAAVAVIVVAIFAWTAGTSVAGWGCRKPAEQSYNLLVEGFQSGRLQPSIRRCPPGFVAQLPDLV